MTDNTPPAQEPSAFRAVLRPHRSLGPKGFLVLMAILSLISFTAGLVFFFMGAWPVVGFLGLDVLLVYVAFRLNYRAGRASEEVSVSRTALDIRKIAPSGKAEAHRFNPFWTKFAVARHEEIGITRMAVEAQGRTVPIGGFLNPKDRESFATAFSRALAAAKS